jgi:hypothetical protein
MPCPFNPLFLYSLSSTFQVNTKYNSKPFSSARYFFHVLYYCPTTPYALPHVIHDDVISCFLACKCEDLGSVSPVCDPENGQCECENNFGGRECSECENGYYNFPTCTCTDVGDFNWSLYANEMTLLSWMMLSV